MFFRKLKMVIIFRADLKLTKGKIGSQAGHAAVMCFKRTIDSNLSLATDWLKIGQPKIVLKVDTIDDLESLRHRAQSSNIVAEIVRDAGRTEILPGTVTCLGLGPDYDDKIDALVKDLKLL